MIEKFTYPKENTFTVYTKSNCIYCTKVKELLKSNNIDYIIVNCDVYIQNSINKEDFLSHMELLVGKKYRTFPMVFNGNNFIGGFDNTENYIESINELNKNINLNFKEDF